jgi:hypothetical protein
MLKKLLASALAVATVATCAYVPAALASAATTTVTADANAYKAYKLLNPDATATSTKSTTNLRVLLDGSSITGTNLDGSYTTVAFDNADHNESYIAANLPTLLAGKSVDSIAAANLDGEAFLDNDVFKKATVKSVYAIGSEYLVSITTQTQVRISVLPDASYGTEKDVSKVAGVEELGWYENGQLNASTLIPAAYASEYNSQTKIASKVFSNWKYEGGLVVAVYKDLTEAEKANYTAITLYRKNGNKTVATPDADLTSGAYYAYAGYAVVSDTLYVPTAEKASCELYLTNYLATQTAITYTPENGDNAGVTYTGTGVKLLTGTNAGKAVVTYSAPAAEAAASKYTTLILQFAGATSAQIKVEDTAQTITEDPETIYAIAKAADKETYTQDTLADYLADLAGENANYVIDKVTSVVRNIAVNGNEVGAVTVTINTVQADKVTVYYYDDVIASKEAYLTADQKAATLTTSVLGIAANTTVGSKDAKFKSATLSGTDVAVTYELGEATVNIEDFTTTTGLFNDKAYYNRAVKAGDDVRLNVALTDKGVAKGLDIAKISVSYEVIGATQNGETYQKEETTNSVGVVLKAGQSTHFTLAAGTNIIVATVSYDGTVIGSFAPFYTYVG